MRIPFSILMEDYENSNKDFDNATNCPANIAVRRQLHFDGNIIVTRLSSYNYRYKGINNAVENEWNRETFEALANGIEFHTFINIPKKYLTV